jgi:hypothetical protein
VAATQLAIRFTDTQIQTLDALASERKCTRSAVVKELVDQAEKARVSALYEAAYVPSAGSEIDQFGDLAAFHGESEQERVAARDAEATW